MMAAVTNLLGAFFGLAVAKTISSGIVDSAFITQPVLVCVLLSAIFWNLLTWWYGIPSSSTHALVGSLIGAALAAAVCINAVKPMVDKEGRPASVWTAMKWMEVKPKKEKKLSPQEPSAELLAAAADKSKINGTHTVELDGKKVQIVAFSGRVREVIEKEKIEKAGVYYKVVIPMVTSPLIGFTAGLIVMAILYAGLRNWRPVTVNRVFTANQFVYPV